MSLESKKNVQKSFFSLEKKMKPPFWMALAAVFYALQYFNVKATDKHTSLHVWTLIVFRGIVGFVVALFVVVAVHKTCHKNVIMGKDPKTLLLRGTLGACSLLASFFAVSFLRLSVATALLSSTPLWSGVLTACRCSPMRWTWKDTVGAFAGMSGIVMICAEEYLSSATNVETPFHRLLGVVLCIGSSFLNAVVSTTVHGLKNEDPWVISLYPMACSAILGMPGALVDRKPLSSLHLVDIVSLCSTGVISVLAQVCRTVALQNTMNMGIVVLRYLDVPLSVVLDILFFGTRPTVLTYGGIGLVLTGGMIVTFSEINYS